MKIFITTMQTFEVSELKEEKELNLPSVHKIKNELELIVQNNIKDNVKNILDKIAVDYQIPVNELYNKYLPYLNIKHVNKDLSPDDQCAHICTSGKKQRCSRRKKDDSAYCGIHKKLYSDEVITG